MHDGARSLEDVLQNACRLWGFGESTQKKPRPTTEWEQPALTLVTKQHPEHTHPLENESEHANENANEKENEKENANENEKALKQARRVTKLRWSTTVDAAIKERPKRAAHIMDPVLQRLRNSVISPASVRDCIALHGLFLVIAPGSPKYPHLIHTIGLAGHGIPELYMRCPEQQVRACAYKMNVLARELIEQNVILPHGTKVRPAGGGAASTRTVGGRTGGQRRPRSSSTTHEHEPSDGSDEEADDAAADAEGNWWVRALNDDELNDINNGLLIQAAKFYDRAVAASEMLPESGWRKYTALHAGNQRRAELEAASAAAMTAVAASLTATALQSARLPASALKSATEGGSGKDANDDDADDNDNDNGDDDADADGVISEKETSATNAQAHSDVDAGADDDGADAGADIDVDLACSTAPSSADAGADIDVDLACGTAPSPAAESPTKPMNGSASKKTCRNCTAACNTMLCSTCSRVGARNDVYKGYRKAAHAYARASPPASRRRASTEDAFSSSVCV